MSAQIGQVSQTKTQGVSSVRSLLIPLNKTLMVLPNTAVAEVAAWQTPNIIDTISNWLLGMVFWRGRSIPLLALEPLIGGQTASGGAHARTIICNTLNGNPQLPFIAIVAQGIPRLQELTAERMEQIIEDAPSASRQPASRLLLDGQPALIPDLDQLESMLLKMGVTVA